MKELRRPNNLKIAEHFELAELGKNAQVVFHDLSNHLTALTLSVGHLEEGLARDTKRLQEYSKHSEKTRIQMEYVASLFRSHIENTGDSRFEPAKEIQSVIGSFSEIANTQEIKIIFRHQKGIEIFGSKNAFNHVITNLISNAIDALATIPKSSVRKITIKLEKGRADMLISVADTGCGIRKEHINRIFDQRFTTKITGHGIGLFATKEFVEKKFGGKIEAKSSGPGCGAEFLVSIPREQKTRIIREKQRTVWKSKSHQKS